MTLFAFGLLLAMSIAGYVWNRQAAAAIRDKGERLHSLSGFHGLYAFLTAFVPVLLVVLVWLLVQDSVIEWLVMRGLPEGTLDGLDVGGRDLIMAEISSISNGNVFGTPEDWKLDAAERMIALQGTSSVLMIVVVGLLTAALVLRAKLRVKADFRARHGVERILSILMIACASLAIFVTIGIVLSLLFESLRFFREVPLTDFLFGTNWEPQIPLREDQIAAEGAFGWLPVILGTLVISAVALIIAIPVGLLAAIYLNEFAPGWFRSAAKPILEILAGVPTVVYGFFAILVVAPAIRSFGASIGLDVAPNTALAAGSVLGSC